MKNGANLIAYEIKTSTSIDKKELSGFIRCLDQLDISEGNVIYFGEETHQLNPRIEVRSVYSLLNQEIL